MRVARVPLVITESRFDQLRTVDVGSLFGAEFADQRLPTLDEVIEATAGKVRLIVELKSYAGDAASLVADVVRTLKARELISSAVVMSLKYDVFQEVERLAPEITSGYIVSARLVDISKLNTDFLAVRKDKATDALVGTAHAQGKNVFVWTVDDPREMATMIDRGVDNIITNDPATLARVLRERADLGTTERILLKFRSLYMH
jgi:glycerophosphoryl diester phosphodiesterase